MISDRSVRPHTPVSLGQGDWGNLKIYIRFNLTKDVNLQKKIFTCAVKNKSGRRPQRLSNIIRVWKMVGLW